MSDHRISESADLSDMYGEPSALVRRKAVVRLDKHCRDLIAASPFLVMATAGADGTADASPRGDAPGFVAVLDDETLLIPDRPGNRRLDSMRNIIENPHVGLIFFVPGMNETLRVNGHAEITTDGGLLDPASVDGKRPATGIVVRVEEAYLHCAKALMRAHLWDPTRHVDRKSFPTLGQMVADQIAGVDAAEADAQIDESYRERLY